MAYGDNMAFLPALSRLMGEVEQPTQNQGMMAPQFGGSPQQLMGMMQSPHMQEQMRQWGINFDPNQMRQSPFFPNQFMQHHPMLGGMLTGGMANAAMTPEAPLVSGAGSGISRAFQGMMGGPEMLRQYQIRQMLSPMQGMGMQMPMQEFQRKQQLLSLLEQMEADRSRSAQGGLDERAREADLKSQDQGVMRQGPRINQQTGETWLPHPAQQAQPEGGRSGLDMMQVPGQGQRQMPNLQGGAPIQLPDWALSPGQEYQPAGWTRQETPLDRIAGVAGAKETPAQKAQREGAGAAGQARADQTRQSKNYDKKGVEKAGTDKQRALQSLEKEYAPYWNSKDRNVRDQKNKELESRKQQIYDWYDSQVQTAGGQTIPGRVGGGNNYMAPNTGNQQGGGGGSQATHIDDAGNLFDAQGNFISGPNGGPYNPGGRR